jgi:hypothetical protein
MIRFMPQYSSTVSRLFKAGLGTEAEPMVPVVKKLAQACTLPYPLAGSCSFQDPRWSVFSLPLDGGGRGGG